MRGLVLGVFPTWMEQGPPGCGMAGHPMGGFGVDVKQVEPHLPVGGSLLCGEGALLHGAG